MIIVINHLTRMKPPSICMAGIDESTGRHVRPMLGDWKKIPNTVLAEHGGPVRIGARVDLGFTRATPTPPEIEDHEFQLNRLRFLEMVDAGAFWAMQERLAKTELRAVFGDELRAIGARGCGLPQGRGAASLGCFSPKRPPVLFARHRPDRPPQVRMILTDGEFHVDAGVTDLRLYEADLLTPREHVCRYIADGIRRRVRVILAMGLCRAFAKTPLDDPMHYVQVNNVFIECDPLLEKAS